MFLECDNLVVRYQHVVALENVSIRALESGVVCLLGANGAGKSSFLRTVSGLVKPSSGEVRFDGESLLGLSPEEIVARGIAHVPEGRRVFPGLTVEENLRIGAYLRRDRHGIEEDLDRVFSYFPRLRERHKQSARTMSGGEQQMLAIGRALMARPKLLLLDEPSMGLAPIVVEEIVEIIAHISRGGMPAVLVEQNASLALAISEYGYVLENRRIALEGAASDLRGNDHVRRAYLGG